MRTEKPCVYRIICPLTKKTRYIGMTQSPSVRFRAHLNKNKSEVGAWIQSLLNDGNAPIFETIERFNYKIKKGLPDTCDMNMRMAEREYFWIRHYLRKGHKLFNKHGNFSYVSPNSKFRVISQPA